MKLSEVPSSCVAARCDACGTYLAIPSDEPIETAAQAMNEHRQMCPVLRRQARERGEPTEP